MYARQKVVGHPVGLMSRSLLRSHLNDLKAKVIEFRWVWKRYVLTGFAKSLGPAKKRVALGLRRPYQESDMVSGRGGCVSEAPASPRGDELEGFAQGKDCTAQAMSNF